MNKSPNTVGRAHIYCDEVMHWLCGYNGEKFHAVLTDVPYFQEEMVKRFSKKSSAPAKPGEDGAFRRLSERFHGETWDDTQIAFDSGMWKLMGHHLHPGGFVVSFSGGERYHKMVTAMEAGGLQMHTFLGWLHAQRMPTPTRIKAEAFAGYYYGKKTITPALEPIALVQKPFGPRPLTDIAEHGAGTFDVAGTKLAAKNGERWPANIVADLEGGAELDSQRCGAAEYFPQATWLLDIEERLRSTTPFFYVPRVSKEERQAGVQGENDHATLKPIALAKLLARMILPPPDYAPRRLLVPFAGAGSEAIGALLAGWDEVILIEQDARYCEIAEQRLDWWQQREAERMKQEAAQMELPMTEVV